MSEPGAQLREPAPRAELETRGVTLPAAAAGSAPAPFRGRSSLIAASGTYAAIDVWIDAPESWADVLTQFRGDVQGIPTELGFRRIGSVVSSRDGGRIRGLLYSVRGRQVSRFTVDAFHPDAAPGGEARLIARVGSHVQPSSDQADRPVTDLYARADQQVLYTSGGAGMSATPELVFAANPRGAGLAITAVHVSTTSANRGTFVLRYQDTGGGPVTPVWSCIIVGGAPVSQQFPQPIFTPADRPIAEVQATIAGIAPAEVELSVEGFNR